MLLAMTFMVACAGPGLQMARAYDGAVVQGAEPIIPGTANIISQDEVVRENVQQLTNYGAVTKIVGALLGISGAAQFTDNAALSYFTGGAVDFIIDHIAPTHRTVTIVFNRYILRGADGKRYYKVYAKYYTTSGKLIDARLALYGLDI